MQKVKDLSNRLTTHLLAAGLYFMAVLSPARVLGQEGTIREPFEDDRIAPTDVDTDIFDTFQTVANILLVLIGAVAVIMLIIGGFRYVASGGDSTAVEGAKNTILYAVIGIVVAFLAYAAINFLTGRLAN